MKLKVIITKYEIIDLIEIDPKDQENPQQYMGAPDQGWVDGEIVELKDIKLEMAQYVDDDVAGAQSGMFAFKNQEDDRDADHPSIDEPEVDLSDGDLNRGM